MNTRIAIAMMGFALAGCTGLQHGDSITTGRVYFGSEDRGTGLYLVNLSVPPNTNAPHLTISGIASNFDVSITLANGYRDEVLLAVPDRETFAIDDITCYDRNGTEILWKEEGRVFTSPSYHRKYENLMGRTGTSSNHVLFCCCAGQLWRLHRQLEFRPFSWPPPMDDVEGGVKPLILPEATQTADLTLAMALEYIVTGDSRRYRKNVEIRVRLERQEGGQPSAGDCLPGSK